MANTEGYAILPVRVFVYCTDASTKDLNKVLETPRGGKISEL